MSPGSVGGGSIVKDAPGRDVPERPAKISVLDGRVAWRVTSAFFGTSAFLARLRQADGDGLLAAFHLAALPLAASRGTALVALHLALTSLPALGNICASAWPSDFSNLLRYRGAVGTARWVANSSRSSPPSRPPSVAQAAPNNSDMKSPERQIGAGLACRLGGLVASVLTGRRRCRPASAPRPGSGRSAR